MTEGDASTGAANTDGGDSVRIEYELTQADVRTAGFVAARFSMGTVAVGAFAVVSGFISYAISGDLIGLVFVIFGLLLGSGVVQAMLTAYLSSRRPDLIGMPTTMEFRAAGIRSVTTLTSSEAAWSTYKRIRRTPSTLLMDLGTGAIVFVPSRAFAPGQLERIEAWAAAMNVLDRSPAVRSIVVGCVIGTAVAAAIPAAIWLAFALGILS